MRRILCCLALGVFLAAAQTGPDPPSSTAIYTHFQSEPSLAVVDSMKQELATILLPAQVHLEWRSLDEVRPMESFTNLAVVKFTGKCDLSDLIPEPRVTGALGRTHMTDGWVIPFCDIDCDRIRALMSKPLVRLPRQDRDAAFGRAIARVLCHELFHVLAQTTHHASSGLAKEAFTAEDLMADGFRFEWGDLTALAAPPNPFHSSQTAIRQGKLLFVGTGCSRCHGSQGEGSTRGPSLHGFAQHFNIARLTARLKDKSSEMSRRAHHDQVQWPSFRKTDIDDLATYLRTLAE